MKVLITSPTYPPFNSGLGNAVAQQAMSLAKAGNEVVVATGGQQRGSTNASGVTVETFVISGADSWLQPIRGDVKSYLRFLRESKWDVVVFNAWQNWATDLAIQHIKHIPGRKFLYSHCISTNTFFWNQPIRSILRYMAWRPYWWKVSKYIKIMDGLIFLAESGVDSRFDDLTLARRLNARVHIIPNALSPAAESLVSRAPRAFNARAKIISVGAFHWQKGFDFVIRAYALSRARNKIPLHLYGWNFTDYSENLRRLIKEYGLLDDSVVFNYGVSGELLAKEYEDAKVFLSGSHTECQPLVILDANAAGTPFIARATGCIHSMAGGVSVSSEREMANKIDLLCFSSGAWAELSLAGRDRVIKSHQPDVVLSRFNDVLLGRCGEHLSDSDDK